MPGSGLDFFHVPSGEEDLVYFVQLKLREARKYSDWWRGSERNRGWGGWNVSGLIYLVMTGQRASRLITRFWRAGPRTMACWIKACRKPASWALCGTVCREWRGSRWGGGGGIIILRRVGGGGKAFLSALKLLLLLVNWPQRKAN